MRDFWNILLATVFSELMMLAKVRSVMSGAAAGMFFGLMIILAACGARGATGTDREATLMTEGGVELRVVSGWDNPSCAKTAS